MKAWAPMAIALGIGMLLPLQGLVNAKLGAQIGGGVQAAFASFVIGTVLIGAWLLATRSGLAPVPGATFPAWIWVGGALGAVYVTCFTLLVPKLGTASLVCLAILGQVTASLLLDHHSVLQPPRPADAVRIAGAVLVVVGACLVAAPWRSSPAG